MPPSFERGFDPRPLKATPPTESGVQSDLASAAAQVAAAVYGTEKPGVTTMTTRGDFVLDPARSKASDEWPDGLERRVPV